MATPSPQSDCLLATCDALLREVAGYPITEERLAAALPLIREILAEIRRLDEVAIDDVEPAIVFRREG